jgi:hypothetical protein
MRHWQGPIPSRRKQPLQKWSNRPFPGKPFLENIGIPVAFPHGNTIQGTGRFKGCQMSCRLRCPGAGYPR